MDHKNNQKKPGVISNKFPTFLQIADCSIIRASEGVFKQFLLTFEEGEDKNPLHCCFDGEMNDSLNGGR